MPLRYASPSAALLLRRGILCRPLSSSARLLQDDVDEQANHYKVLNVHPEATAAEIKKSFYTLSKSHHPDHNPTDPHAPRRFMRISEAYSILSHNDKRAIYDRDVMRRHHPGVQAQRHGSYHSSSPAGGRPATGLSRRRGSFQGPPPSFFRSGSWGSHAAKRRTAHEESTGGAENPSSSSSYATSGLGGMGPGQDPYGHQDDVPHFDRTQHERTHRKVGDERRARRATRRDTPFDTDSSLMVSFIAVVGILSAAIVLPFAGVGLWRHMADNNGKKRSPK